jgi:hypothetical protein
MTNLFILYVQLLFPYAQFSKYWSFKKEEKETRGDIVVWDLNSEEFYSHSFQVEGL